MKLRVQYTAQLRTAIGRNEEDIELPPASDLTALLLHLAARHGREAEPHLFTSSGQAQPSLLVVVNGAAVFAHDAGARVLQPDDVVMLMPPIAGG